MGEKEREIQSATREWRGRLGPKKLLSDVPERKKKKGEKKEGFTLSKKYTGFVDAVRGKKGRRRDHLPLHCMGKKGLKSSVALMGFYVGRGSAL